MNLFESLILGRKGGATSVRIIDLLLDTPCNISQISKIVNIHYTTADYHIDLLSKNDIVKKDSNGYGALYFPGSILINNIEEYNNAKKELKKRNNILKEAVKDE